MKLFWKKENRADDGTAQSDDVLLKALLTDECITKDKALQIPSVASAVNKIAETVAKLPLKLYKNENHKIVEVTDDKRLFLINKDTGDTLTTVEFWKAIIEDYYLDKGGYIYINKDRGNVKSLHYVDATHVSVINNQNAIFKDYDIYVDGVKYFPHDFIKIFRKTKGTGVSLSICEENSKLLTVTYNSLNFENNLIKKGGNKKGFLKSKNKLSKEALTDLKTAIRNLYSNDAENEKIVVLNDGVEFQETSATSVEMQLNENKNTNSGEVFKLFGFPVSNVIGGATKADKDLFNDTVVNLLNVIEAALDKDLLLECEKENFYFAFDTKELTRGSIKERFEAYGIALDKHFMQTDEIRALEDLEPIGFNFVKLGLGDVLYNPETKEVFIPNINQTNVLDGKGG